MKRFVGMLVVLTLALGTAVGVRLWQQGKAAQAPAGSSGIVEGTRVLVSSRLASRVLKVLVREGDAVDGSDDGDAGPSRSASPSSSAKPSPSAESGDAVEPSPDASDPAAG